MKQNKELIHYLNSGVKVQDNEDNNIYSLYGVSLAGGSELLLLDKNSRVVESSLYSVTPYLYPLSFLTETINHEEVDEIPLVELAKIEGSYNNELFEIIGGTLCWIRGHLTKCTFRYSPTYQSFIKELAEHNFSCANQLTLFQYLFSRRINVFGIDAIDPRTLGDKNPYLITNKK